MSFIEERKKERKKERTQSDTPSVPQVITEVEAIFLNF
jgi:hypothetical protein